MSIALIWSDGLSSVAQDTCSPALFSLAFIVVAISPFYSRQLQDIESLLFLYFIHQSSPQTVLSNLEKLMKTDECPFYYRASVLRRKVALSPKINEFQPSGMGRTNEESARIFPLRCYLRGC
jgi:hypothetical protein